MLKIFSLKMKLIFISITLGVIPVLLIGSFSIMKFDSFAKETISKSYKELEEQAFANIQSGVNAELEKIKPLISRAQRLVKRLAASPNIPLYLHAGSRAISTAKKEAEQIVKGLSETCKVQYKLVKDKVDLGLYTAEFIFQNKGRVYLSSSRFIEWKCANQFTGHTTNAIMPQFHVGTEPIEKIYDYEDEFSPIVDDLQEMTGVNSSIFQKINDSGDMVRIATNVRNADGTRAIESYIPAFNPDGKANPVIERLLRGEPFKGIAYENNADYISIYKPLFNDSGTLLGAIFVGVPAKSMTLVDAITKAKIGKLGYTYILNSKGDILIHPRPDLTGKNVLSDLGLSNFREVLENKDEEVVNLHFYTFEMQQKFISYLYFAPRDWIICVSGVLADLQSEEISRSQEVLKMEFVNLNNSSKIKITGNEEERFLFNQIRYLNNEGEEVLSLRSSNFTEDLKFKGRTSWFEEALKQEESNFYNSGVVKAINTGKVEMRVSAPVFEDGKLNGIVVLNMDWDIMGEILKNRVYGKTGYAFIIDENGLVVTHPKISIEDNINYSHERYGKLAKIVKDFMLKGKKGHDRYSYKGEDYLIYYVPFELGQKQYCLGATGPVNEFLSMANRIRKDAEKEFGLILKIIIISICICIILSSSIGILVSRTISNPIDKVVSFAKKVSEGDLSETLKTRKRDEIGHLLEAINTMVLAFRKIVKDVKLNGKRLAGESDDMVKIAGKLAGNSEKMSDQASMVTGTSELMSDNINVIASRVEEMSVNVKNISITTEQVSHNINTVAASIEEMSSSMSDVGSLAKMGSQIAGEAVIMAGKAGDTMSSLGKAANEIGGVTEVIKRLAYKTNLLALNASIEAASAGEAGKGFSVVASAIQHFAEQSNQAAEDIALRISGVQDSSSDAVSVIADVLKIIKDINHSSETILNSVEEQTRAADEIASNAIQADSGAKAIALSISEFSQGSNDISKNIADVAMGANGVAGSIKEVSLAALDSNAGIRNVNKSAVELERLAGYLQALVENFKMEENNDYESELDNSSSDISKTDEEDSNKIFDNTDDYN